MLRLRKSKKMMIAVMLAAIVLVPLLVYAAASDGESADEQQNAAASQVHVPNETTLEMASEYNKQVGGQSMVVMHQGKVIFEEYDNGGSANEKHLLASGSKSFVGLTAIAAVEDEFIRLDDPVSNSITEWKTDPEKSKITYRQLLSFTSGLTSSEPGKAITGTTPSWAEVITKPMKYKPGEKFEYGAYHLYAFGEALQRILMKETGESFEAYLKRRILDPLGVEVEWRMRCEDGNPQLGGGAYMLAEEWAKVGEFVRNKGVWNGKQIIASVWFDELTKGTKANPAYGLTWWLKESVPEELDAETGHGGEFGNSPWLPEDLFMAAGLGEQRLYVLPSLELIAVRQGPVSAARTFSDVAFLSRLLRGIPDETESDDTQDPMKNAIETVKGSILLQLDHPYAVVSGKKVSIDDSLLVKPFLSKGQTLVPMRFVSEKFGAEVNWDQKTSTATIVYEDVIAHIKPDSLTTTVNGKSIDLGSEAKVVDGRLFLPLRVVAENILSKHVLYEDGVIMISDKPKLKISPFLLKLLE